MRKRTSEKSKKIHGLDGILLGLAVVFVTIFPLMTLIWWAVVPTESTATSNKFTALIGAVLLTFAVIRIKQYTHSILRRIEKKLENRAC